MKEVSKKLLSPTNIVFDVSTTAYSSAASFFILFFTIRFPNTVDKLATMSNSVSKENI